MNRSPGAATPLRLRAQATAELERVLDELAGPNPDLVGISMRAMQAFRILGAQKEFEYLRRELRGYAGGDPEPYYRQVLTTFNWKTDDSRAVRSTDLAPRTETTAWHGALATWVSGVTAGSTFPTRETKRKYSNALSRYVTWTEWGTVPGSVFQQQLDHYRAELHDLVGKWVITLLTAEQAEPLWDALRE